MKPGLKAYFRWIIPCSCLIPVFVLLAGCTAPSGTRAASPYGEKLGRPQSRIARAKKKAKPAQEEPQASPFGVPESDDAGAPQPPTSPPRGLYSLDAQIGFDTLDGVSYHPAQGTLALFGHRTRGDGRADLPYLDLLAAALDSTKPVFSLEWTAASQREVDRALAYYADDRNNEDITTRMAKIFDANGRLNRKGAAFFKALGVDLHEGMDRYEFNASLLAAAGRPNAGEALRTFGAMVEAIKRGEHGSAPLEALAQALGLYDFIAGKAAEYRNGQITIVELMDAAMPRLLSGLAQAFGWDDSPYVSKYWRLRRSGSSYENAGDEALFDLQNNLNTLPRQALDAIMARTSEIVVPPDVMREVLGAEPRVRPVLTGLPDHTRLALTACEADAFCKTLFDMPGLQAKVPRYQGYFAWLRDRGQHPAAGEGHLWTSPGDFELLESTDRQTLRFGRTPMQFHIEKYAAGRRSVANPQLSAYADLLTACYDDIAREYPVLHQLRECTKMVAVAQWLKERGYPVVLPRAGRESVNLPVVLPGVIYMVMAVKQGPIGEILTAAGGHDYSGDNPWRYTPRDTAFPSGDLVDRTAREIREKLEQISGRKIEVPLLRPMAELKTEEIGGQKVTTVTVATGAGAENAAPAVQWQRSPEQDALLLWKANDLTGAELALRRQIEAAAGDERQVACLKAWLAQILHEKGDDAAAIKELNEAAKRAPGQLIFKLLAVKSLVESGDLASAKAALRQYLELDPTNQAAARWLADLQAPQSGGAGAPAAALAALGGGRVASGTWEDLKAKPFDTNYEFPKLALTGHAPELRKDIKNDRTLIDLQKKRDDLLAAQRDKDAAAAELSREIATTPGADVVKRVELEAKATRLKTESSQAGMQAKAVDNDIQKRVQLLIDTSEAPPAPGDQKTFPPEAPASGQ